MSWGVAVVVFTALAAALTVAIRRKHGALFIGSSSALFWCLAWIGASQLGDPTLRRLEHLNHEVNSRYVSASAAAGADDQRAAFVKKARLHDLHSRVLEVERGDDSRAVLVVDTGDEEWVLDGRSRKPRRREELVRLGYRFTDRESPPSGDALQRTGSARADPATGPGPEQAAE